MISAGDANYLSCVETKSFMPIGWLYESIFNGLLQRGLVAFTLGGGYIISDHGAEELATYRATLAKR